MRNFVIGVLVALLFVFSSLGGVIADRIVGLNILDKYIPRNVREQIRETKVLSEDEYLSEMLEKVGPAVVTVAVKGTRPDRVFFDWNDFGVKREEGEEFQQDIGSGFVVDAKNGLVVTNRHVVGQ